MALRARDDIAPSVKSAQVGARVEFRAKIENTGAEAESVALRVEDLKEGALGKPVAFAFVFEPASVEVKPKGRAVVAFVWSAALPEGKTAFTFRGRLVLERADGAPVASAPLDLYVST